MVLARALGLIGLVAVAATPVHAQDSAKADDPATRMVCKKVKKTGTRFETRTCRTAKQWDDLAELARREGKDMIDKASALAQVKQNGP